MCMLLKISRAFFQFLKPEDTNGDSDEVPKQTQEMQNMLSFLAL